MGALEDVDWSGAPEAAKMVKQIVKDGGIRTFLSRNGRFEK
jgi:hypothetical protein